MGQRNDGQRETKGLNTQSMTRVSETVGKHSWSISDIMREGGRKTDNTEHKTWNCQNKTGNMKY